MQTNSYISAAALAAALLAAPQPAIAQTLGLNLNLGSLLDVDADVDVGGDSLVDVDAGVNLGGDDGLDVDANVDVGGSGDDDALVDLDLGVSSGSDTDSDGGGLVLGPNGGKLIDLKLGHSGDASVTAHVDLLGGDGGHDRSLINGDIRIAALSRDSRRDALLGLIDHPRLADIDLDAAIDDRRVVIIAAVELLGPDELLDVRAKIALGGHGRGELHDALSASVELGAILGHEGIDLDDVLAVQIGENGATEVIVLDGAVELALLGHGGDLADLTVDQLASVDLDLLSEDELAEINLDLLPPQIATAVQIRLLGDDEGSGDTIGDLAAIDLNLLPGLGGSDDDDDGGTGTGGTGGTGTGGTGGTGGTDTGGTGTGGTGTGGTGTGGTGGGDTGTGGGSDGGSDDGTTDPGSSDDDDGTDPTNTGGISPIGNAVVVRPPLSGGLGATPVGASFGIAALTCDIGVLALASGTDATPQAIAGADSLELVRIEGCERTLMDTEVDQIRAAILANRAISGVLDDAQVPLDEVIGATIQGDTLTLFIEPEVS